MATPSDPVARNPDGVRARLDAMERLLERLVVIPGVRVPVGLDALLGLVPIGGDAVTAAMGLWLLWEARNLGMSRWQMAGLATRTGADLLIGAIPVVGDVADVLFRSNTRNLRAIRRHLDRHFPA